MATTLQYTPIPYLRETPLIGSIRAINTDRFGFLTRVAQLGPVGAFHMGPLTVVVFNEPQFVQSLLVEQAKNTEKGWTMHRSFVGNGVFISEGEFHAKQRKVMAPSFTPQRIATYADIMASYSEKLVQTWKDGQQVNLSKAMSAVTTGIIGKSLFDEDVFSEADELGKSLVVVFNHAAHMVTSPFALPRDWPTPRNRAKDRAWEIIRNRLQEMIDERRAHPVPRNDFLSLLMEARDDDGNPMDDVQLMDEASTLFTGGQETVANSMNWTWMLLCEHPEIYQAVRNEVDSVLAGRTPTLEDTKRLPLCLQVFKEALRLYPPAPVTIREASQDHPVTDGEHTYLVKKGSTEMASIYAIHRMEEHFPEPDTFNPTVHFAPEHEKSLPRYAFMPFGAGPRVCIGNHFAMLEGHLILATLAQRVQFSLVPGQTIFPSSKTLTTKPEQDIQVTVQFR